MCNTRRGSSVQCCRRKSKSDAKCNQASTITCCLCESCFSIVRYYEGGTSSVYLWEDDEKEGFLACFLIKKDGSKYAHGVRGYLNERGWDAIHLIEVGPEVEGMAYYCLTSTVMLSMTTDHENSGTFSLYGPIRRQG
ncbi:unnamed protein product [Lactuca virosa]|uniref:F-actin-capping protein subunit beta n=1 Tax=Lactuca virosa TaxID=75947 RepID=A0AAU9PBV7_9ASTR|nr:unnamed protein product [Lactuca virosa]